MLTLLAACDKAPAPTGAAAPSAAAAAPVAPQVGPSVSFAPDTAARTTVEGGACNFDVIDGQNRDLPEIVAAKGKSTRYYGWAVIDQKQGVMGGDVQLLLKGAKNYMAAPVRFNRPDVVAFFKQDNMLGSGFTAMISVDAVDPGAYELITLIQQQERWVICPNKRKFVVR